jgi:hypothetical protein
MAKQRHHRRRFLKPGHGLRRGKNVFVFISVGAMNQRQPVGRHRTLRKLLEVLQVFLAKLRLGPARGKLRRSIEIRKVGEPGHGLVMIASDDGGLGARMRSITSFGSGP